MSTLVTPRLSRLLALALLVLVIAVPYLVIVRPYIEALGEGRETLAETVALRDRYVALAAGGAAIDAKVGTLRDEGDGEAAYLQGASEALVSADLQNRVKTVVQANGGVLNSTQILDATNEEGFRRLAVRVRMSGGSEALYKVLYALETERPFLFIDNIDINARTIRQREGQGETIELMVSFDLFGFMRPAAS
jgi:general secretion pathway protein M